jgi:hypothetical protein
LCAPKVRSKNKIAFVATAAAFEAARRIDELPCRLRPPAVRYRFGQPALLPSV